MLHPNRVLKHQFSQIQVPAGILEVVRDNPLLRWLMADDNEIFQTKTYHRPASRKSRLKVDTLT